MNPRDPVQRLFAVAQQLASLTSPQDILATAGRELLALTGAPRVFASYRLPGEAWERGVHLEITGELASECTPAARSALFAVHRRVALRRSPIELRASADDAAIFAGLRAGPALHAIPIVHRTGRWWGELVITGVERLALDDTLVGELARYATVALESVHRLAFARRDQDRLLLLAEATDDALYDHHFDTRDFWWGGGILKLFGSDADPVENTARWKERQIHPDDRDRVRASFEAAREAKAMRWRDEYRFQRHDGAYRVVEDRCYFLRDARGRAYRVIGSMRDVTAIKQLLAREQEARAEAESASRAKDEFLAMLGHELRNPLAPIVTGLELLRVRGPRALDRELPVLQRQARHLITLVDDLLDISRITHGKIELKREPFELAIAVAAAIETASPLIESRGHRLDVDVAARGLEVVADRARLAQAVANLLTNAAKYTEPGGRIAVSARRIDDRIELAVRDTGIGIAPEMLPHVFSMFVQERQALDRSQGGLGLGLSIVRSLIELHGGTAEVTSAGRGHGSTFTIRLPVAREGAIPRPDVQVPPPAPPPTGRKILVVDDNEDAADLLASLLEHLGNQTRVAHEAQAALRIVGEFAPEICVLDIGLPVIDGYELARQIRHRFGGSIHLIALTGYGQASDKERAKQAGFDAHLVKPVALDALRTLIAELPVVEPIPAVRAS